MTIRTPAGFALGLFAAVLLTGCANTASVPPPHETAHEKLPPAGPHGRYTITWPDLGANGAARYIVLDLGPDMAEQCNMRAPHFFFDAAKPRPQDATLLHAFADCLTSGNLGNVKLDLVGHTDPRGRAAYNKKLGIERARNIKQLLVHDGVPAQRIDVSTAGETNAKGNQAEYSFGWDRRVDIVVRGRYHHPA